VDTNGFPEGIIQYDVPLASQNIGMKRGLKNEL